MNLSQLLATYLPDPLAVRRPYLIAEAGVNHEGDMNLATRLIEEAAAGGAHAIKFQSYKAATLASKHSPAYWDTTKETCTSQFQLFSRYDRFWKGEYEQLARRCEDAGIAFMSTPFDAESARFLEPLMPAIKIASADLTNKPLIQQLAAMGKPILLSTGASHLHEIEEALSWIGGVPVVLLHCVLNYPTPAANANLGMIKGLQRKFPDHLIGYSDHTLPGRMQNLISAVLLGAVVLEKHFTFDKGLPGNDHYHAMDKDDLIHFNRELDLLFQVLGRQHKGPIPDEEPARRHARRALYATRDLPAGHRLEVGDLIPKRPAHGVPPKHLEEVLGHRLAQALGEDTPLQWFHLGGEA